MYGTFWHYYYYRRIKTEVCKVGLSDEMTNCIIDNIAKSIKSLVLSVTFVFFPVFTSGRARASMFTFVCWSASATRYSWPFQKQSTNIYKSIKLQDDEQFVSSRVNIA